jgi:hypothetical protein
VCIAKSTRGLVAAALLPLLVSNALFAAEGYGTVTFTVEVTGVHNRPTEEGGYRNTEKRRVFQGQARMRYAGAGPSDIWVSESCSGTLEVADKGTYKPLNPFEGWGIVPTAVSGRYDVKPGLGANGCSFNLEYDPTTNRVRINLDQPGPRRLEVVEYTNVSTFRTHLNPFDWSALRKLESAMLPIDGGRTSHSGEWLEKGGEPLAMVSVKRVADEVVETQTRITWQFTGELPAEGKIGAPRPPIPKPDQDPSFQCVKEQAERGVEFLDMEEYERCLEAKQQARRT